MLYTALTRHLALTAIFLFLTTAPAAAQTTYTWTGLSPDDDGWFDGLNWLSGGNPIAPVTDLANTAVVLTGTTRLTNTLDYSFSANSLTFDAAAGAFVVGTTGTPQTLTLGTGGLTVASGNANNQTFNANLTLGAAQTWANNGTGSLALGGTVTVGTSLLTLAGSGGISTAGGSLSLGAGGVTNTNTGTVNLGSPVTLTASSTITNNASGGTFAVSGSVTNGGNLLTVGGSADTTISAAISGGGGLTKSGAGVLVLGGTNTYTGTTTVSAGTVRAAVANTFSPSSAVSLANATGVVIDLNNLGQTVASVAGGGASGGNIALGSGTLTIGGTAATTFSGLFTGAGTVAKTNAGTLTLRGNSTWTGPFTVSGGGVISIDNATRLGPIATANGPITLDNGTIEETNLGANGTFTPPLRNIVLGAGGGTFSYTTAATLIIVQTGTVISGTAGGALNKTGAGIIAVVTPATYDGPTNVLAGTLRVRTNSNVFPITTALTVASGATFDLSTLSQQVGSVAGAGNVNIGGATFTVNGSTSTTFSGLVTGTGILAKSGTSTLTLTGLNTYTGATRVNNGTLSVDTIANVGGGNTALGAPTTVANGTIAVGSTTTAGTLQYTGAVASTDRVVNLAGTTGGATLDSSGTGALTFTSNFTATGAGSKTLTLTGSNTGNNTVGGVIPNNSGTNTTALTKAGTGTWVLTGANTYTGPTAVNAGVLSVGTGGSLAGGSAVTVNDTATLRGTGTVGGSVTVQPGGTLRGGDGGIGTVTVNGNVVANATTVSAARLGVTVDATTASLIAVTGTSTVDFVSESGAAPFVIQLSVPTLTFGTEYQRTIVTAGGGFLSDTQAVPGGTSFNLGSDYVLASSDFPSFNAVNLQVSAGGTDLVLTFTPAPEPGTVMACAAVALGFGGLIRRRTRRA